MPSEKSNALFQYVTSRSIRFERPPCRLRGSADPFLPRRGIRDGWNPRRIPAGADAWLALLSLPETSRQGLAGLQVWLIVSLIPPPAFPSKVPHGLHQ
jgi:hypothetical protein